MKTHLTTIAILIYLLTLHTGIADTTPSPESPSTDIITKVYTLGLTPIHEAQEAITPLLSARGKIVTLARERKILVQDTPDHMATIDPVMRILTAPRPNIRIEISFSEDTHTQDRRINVTGRGRVRTGNTEIEINNEPHWPPQPPSQSGNRVRIDAIDRNILNEGRSTQFLLVQSGSEATIHIGQDIPFVDYFWTYALGLGLITETQTRWRSIGSRLWVKPIATDDHLIHLEVIPELSTLVGNREEIIRFRHLATTLTVAHGTSVQIGSFAEANDEFNRAFFTCGHSRQATRGTITLRALIQKP